MRQSNHTIRPFIILLVSLLLAGCATNTVVSRKEERLAAYEALTPELRTAVDQGQIKAGMNTDAVYIAWGKPSQIVTGGNQTGETITWIYQASYLQEAHYWGAYRMHYVYTPMTYVRAQVIFTNNVVKEWQTFPAPVNY